MSRTETRIHGVVAALEPSAAEATRNRLERMRLDCGCREGALLMLAATIGTAVYLVLDAQARPASTIALMLVAVLFGSAAIGKAIGLLLSRARLLLTLSRLERTVVVRSAGAPPATPPV